MSDGVLITLIVCGSFLLFGLGYAIFTYISDRTYQIVRNIRSDQFSDEFRRLQEQANSLNARLSIIEDKMEV